MLERLKCIKMTATIPVFNLFYLMSILTSWGAHGVKIQAYHWRNLTGKFMY